MKRNSEVFREITQHDYLYNIQSIDNIASIVKDGILSYELANGIKHTSLAMTDVQQKRANVNIPNGMNLHQYANLYFSFWNPMLSKRRDENRNLCILAIDADVLDIDGVVVSDMNAACSLVSFYPAYEGLKSIRFEYIFAKYWTDSNYDLQQRKKYIKCAEVLVPHRIPYKYIKCACVSNEDAKEIMENVGFDKRIIVDSKRFF